jgi:cellulose synthase (UDP-forming)
VVRTAKIHIYYAFSPSLLPQLSHIKLIMNGTLFATIQPTPGQSGGSSAGCGGGVHDSARAAGA